MPDHILQFFAYEHLPPTLQAVSKPFCDLARAIVGESEALTGMSTVFPLPQNPERTVALRKLLEAKDAAVRANLAKPMARQEPPPLPQTPPGEPSAGG